MYGRNIFIIVGISLEKGGQKGTLSRFVIEEKLAQDILVNI